MVIGGSFAAYMAAMIVDLERERLHRRKLKAASFQMYAENRSKWHRKRDNPFIAWWNERQESEKTILSLIAINSLVFVSWRLPRLERFMTQWFTHSTTSHPLTMLTSTFSHVGGIHFLFNMIALYSFGRVVHEKMGREQFLAFYVASGLVSSGGSHALRVYRGDLTRSLGASGAVFGIVGACAHQPNLRVSLIFVPFVSIPLYLALPAMMTYDAVGVFKNWRVFDHAAHLSGVIFGYTFFKTSVYHIWPLRRKILNSIGYPFK